MDLSLLPYNTNVANKASVIVEYKECMRNHAASMGRNAYDGCGEFMQAGARETLTCAACGCHRNFHRKEVFESCVGLLRLPVAVAVVVGRKRRRTKFTQEQKEKMRAFAERVGWRIRRSDYGELGEFCEEVGVKRDVLKVWMYNNKTHFVRGLKCGSGEVH